MLNTRTWRKKIKESYGIQYVSQKEIEGIIGAPNLLWVTRCCLAKSCASGLPTEMYNSSILRYFYRFAQEKGLHFAIVSDKHGLHFSDERLPYYDIHPSMLSAEDKKRLGAVIRSKADSRNLKGIIFYNNSPLMSKPYFEMLSESGLEVFFTTRLPNMKTGARVDCP